MRDSHRKSQRGKVNSFFLLSLRTSNGDELNSEVVSSEWAVYILFVNFKCYQTLSACLLKLTM